MSRDRLATLCSSSALKEQRRRGEPFVPAVAEVRCILCADLNITISGALDVFGASDQETDSRGSVARNDGSRQASNLSNRIQFAANLNLANEETQVNSVT